MGVVYKARDERLGRLVALKFLPPHLGDHPVARERFTREARAASALDHANLCTIYDIGETEDGSMFICMAYYEGESLKQRLARGPLAIDDAVSVARQVAEGLGCAHRAGILHRDIKPANLMLTARGEVKVVDFGLADLVGEARLTRTGTTMGTVPYMAPEQVRGDELDSRCDLWALGAVMYEMLTAHRPFDGRSEAAVMHAILEHRPPPPSSLRPEIPEALDHVVDGLLTKDPAARIAAAEAVVDVLSGRSTAAADMGTTTALAVPPRSTRRWQRPAVIAAAAVAAVAVAVGAVLGFGSLLGGRGPGYRSLAVMPFENFTGDAAKDFLADGIASGLITRLGALEGLEVVGRSEAWRLRGSSLAASQIGARLGVGVLLEGGVAQSGDHLIVTTNLVDVRSGRVVWSEQMEGAADDLLGLEQHIADRLVRVLEISLSPHERQRLALDPTRSFAAYELYLKGERLLETATDAAGVTPAVEMYRQALQLDDGFALAWAGLSEALWERAKREGSKEALAEADAAARKALELDPELPAAQIALARVLRGSGQYQASISELEAALARNPNPAEAWRELASSYERVGDLQSAEDALRSATAAAPRAWRNWNELGGLLWSLGRYDEARDAFGRAADLAAPEISRPRENLAAVEISQGHFDAALDAYAKIPTPITSSTLASNIGTAFFFSNRRDRFQRAEEYYRLAVRLNPRSDQVRRNLADVLLKLGRRDDAEREYRHALALIEERAATDPNDRELGLRRAFYAARAERCEDAVRWAGELALELPATAENAHRLAYVFALCGRRDEALEQLRRAIDAGVSPDLLREEDEFATLRSDPEFKKLVEAKTP